MQGLSKTLAEWGTREGDSTIAGVDKLKQVIDDFRIGSQDSKKFDTFVTSLRSEAKNIIRNNLTKSKDLKTLLTYDKMLGDFEKSTKDIREIQKALSLGDKASTDTAFRKLSTVLRTNNEMRRQAVKELNDITGGTLIPKIAGQQLSEILPRGLARTLGTVGAGAGLVSGAGIVPMLKLALVSSPRAVGEILNVLGIVGNKANIVKNALLKAGVKSPGDYIFDSNSPVNNTATKIKAIQKGTPNLIKPNITKPAISASLKNGISKTLPQSKMPSKPINLSKDLEPLAQEARKYKSAEEFVKAQGTPVYRGEGGSNVAQGKALLAEGKHYASDAEYPKGFGKVGEYVIKPDAKVLDLGDSTFQEISKKLGIPEKRYISPKELSTIAKEKGYSVLKYNGEYKSSGKQFTHTVDLTGDSYIPKSQLTDFYNKAVGKKGRLPTKPPKLK